MAFQSSAGWNNLPNGVFSPVIFSKEVQLAFRKETVVGAVTNNKYFGEIAGFGDTVRIMKEPTIEIRDYARGKNIEPQNLIDEDFQLTIDQAREFSFHLEDIEKKHSHVDFMSLASSQAAYKVKDAYDVECLAYMAGYKYNRDAGTWSAKTAADIPGTKAVESADDDELFAGMKLKKGDFGNITTSSAGDHSIPIGPRVGSVPTAYASAIQVINRMGRQLDLQLAPREGRWLIIDPYLHEVLQDEDSKFLNADFGESGALRNGLVLRKWNGFRVYVSNNLPQIGSGPGATGTDNQNTDYGILLAGHDSAVATAEQIDKVENLRSQNTFADIVRGLHVYGRKILRPEALVTAKWNLAQ